MNPFRCVAIVLLSSSAICMCLSQELRAQSKQSSADELDLRGEIMAAGGCNVNICFAIDASPRMTRREFRNVRNFVLDVVSVIGVDEDAEFAAVQFGTTTRVISSLTTKVSRFVRKVGRTRPVRLGPLDPVGIHYCATQLSGRPDEANKIILIVDRNFRRRAEALEQANEFRNTAQGDVCVVSSTNVNNDTALALAGGENSRVFEVDDFLDVLRLEDMVELFVANICSLSI